MPSVVYSVVGEAVSTPNYNNLVHVCSVLKYLAFLGASTAFYSSDAAARDWAKRYFILKEFQIVGVQVPDVTADSGVKGVCEILLRAFPAGSFPARPANPKVIDMVLFPDNAPGDSDFVLSFYGDNDPAVFTGVVATNVISPLPAEVALAHRNYVVGKCVVFLGTDPLGRSAGIVSEIVSGGNTASSVTFPSSVMFWDNLVSAEVVLASAGVPALTAVTMGIPTLLVANSAAEDANIQMIVPTGLQGWEYLGLLSSLTNKQVGDQVKDLLLTTQIAQVRRSTLSAHGLLRQREQGVRRIAEWIMRYHVGTKRVVVPLQSYPQWPFTATAPDPGKV